MVTHGSVRGQQEKIPNANVRRTGGRPEIADMGRKYLKGGRICSRMMNSDRELSGGDVQICKVRSHVVTIVSTVKLFTVCQKLEGWDQNIGKRAGSSTIFKF